MRTSIQASAPAPRARLTRVLLVVGTALLIALGHGSTVATLSPSIVISQVYGGGGNSGATYKNDFIELFNRGAAPASLAGWSLQYASATGTGNFGSSATLITELPNVVLQPGQYLLVQEAQGAGGTTDLPTPDVTDATPINMSGTGGKVALVSSTTTLGCNGGSTPCSPAQLALIVDLVGWDGANFYEGTPAPATTNTTAALRNLGGCAETDNNAADFAAGAPTPRNTAFPPNPCGGPTPPGGIGAASPASVGAGEPTTLTVAATPGANPTSTGLGVVIDLGAIGGSAMQPMFDDGTHGDVIPGDLVFTYAATVGPATTAGSKSLPFSVTDAQARTGSGAIALTVAPPLSTIPAIQGSGVESPLKGQAVRTRGIVTARKTNGFFIQDAGDGDPATSDGVFVFTSSAPPVTAAVGNEVEVTGSVSEFVPSTAPGSAPLTEIVGPLSISAISTGNPLPAAMTIHAASLDPQDPSACRVYLESLEGMRIAVDSLTVVAPTDGTVNEANATSTSNGVFYGVLTGTARPLREAGIDVSDPNEATAPPTVPRFDGNPERLRVDSDGQVGGTLLDVAAGDVLTGLVGVMDYGFLTYTLLPDPGASPFITSATAAGAPPAGPREFTVASFNMERFFDTVNDPATSDAVLTATAFDRRLGKASLVIRTVLGTPDILGVEEVENLATLQAVADRVNADALAATGDSPGYQAYLVEGNDIGGIDVGFLVKATRVQVVAVTQHFKTLTWNDPVGGPDALLFDRPPLQLDAVVLAAPGLPAPITVVVNHLRSLNGIDAVGIEGERVRQKRALEARALAELIDTLQADPGRRVAVIGDFNAFEVNDGYVDVMGALEGHEAPADQVLVPVGFDIEPDYVNLLFTLPAQARYSYVFDGNAETFDHVLVTQDLWTGTGGVRVSGFGFARVGADFPEVLRSDGGRPERLSDHDVPVAYFQVEEADLAVTLTGPASALTGHAFSYTAAVSNAGPDAATNVTATTTVGAPATLTGVQAPAGWSCALAVQTVTCTSASLAAGDTASIAVNAVVPCDTPDGGTVVATTTVSGALPDTNPANNTATATTAVSNPPPVISGLGATPNVLWPPNHQMVDVALGYEVTDNCSAAPACQVGVSSSEPTNGLGDGDTAPDWEVMSANAARLRAERSGTGPGRIYSLTVTCTDAGGAFSSKTTSVFVPKSQGSLR